MELSGYVPFKAHLFLWCLGRPQSHPPNWKDIHDVDHCSIYITAGSRAEHCVLQLNGRCVNGMSKGGNPKCVELISANFDFIHADFMQAATYRSFQDPSTSRRRSNHQMVNEAKACCFLTRCMLVFSSFLVTTRKNSTVHPRRADDLLRLLPRPWRIRRACWAVMTRASIARTDDKSMKADNESTREVTNKHRLFVIVVNGNGVCSGG